jgi:hypothetical protein
MKSRLHREVLVLDGHDINELNIVSVIPSVRTIDLFESIALDLLHKVINFLD